MRNLSVSLMAAALWALPQAARADCVALDTARDSLAPDEQRAAQVLLEDALADTGLAVSAAPCAQTWMVSHVRLGSSITVRLSQGSASQQMTVAQIEELPAAYERLVRAIQTGQPVAVTADRDSVTSAEESPRRVSADSLVYIQLGGGLNLAEAPQGGTAIGGGYRYALDNIAIDIGAFNLVIPANIDDSELFTMSVVELSALYYLDGGAASSAYVGGGVGYGFGVSGDGEGQGLQLQGTVGYELLRQSTIRLFPQLDFVAPVYSLGDEWVPTVSATLNVAFRPQGNGSVPWWVILF